MQFKVYDTDSFIKESINVHGNKYDYSNVNYTNYKTNVIIICKIHGKFEQTPNNHINGKSGCPYCVGQSVCHENSLYSKRKDIVIYFKNIEDSKKCTEYSTKIYPLICPTCSTERNDLAVKELSLRGFNCKICSDGISIPEKFGINLLKQLCVDFETQKVFDWAKDKRYDFYFKLNNDKYIVETHGMQHYEESSEYSKFKRTLVEEQENDLLKYNLAIENEIKPENYIVIDCRYSEFEWLKENYIKSLEHIFDLIYIDLFNVWSKCQNSLIDNICILWNKNISVKDISEELKINKGTVRKYLKIGTELNICDYNSKVESENIIKSNSIKTSKQVNMYDRNGNFLKTFSSTMEAKRITGVNNTHISSNARGERKSAGGYIWKYSKG